MKRLLLTLCSLVLAYGASAQSLHEVPNTGQDAPNELFFFQSPVSPTYKTKVDCDSIVDEVNVADSSAYNRIALDPTDQFTFWRPVEASYISTDANGETVAEWGITRVLQQFDLDYSGYDSLAVTAIDVRFGYIEMGATTDDFTALMYTGEVEFLQSTSYIFPSQEVHTQDYPLLGIFQSQFNLPELDAGGETQLVFNDPPNLVNNANFFNNNQVFVGYEIKNPAKDDSIFQFTSRPDQGLGQGLALYYREWTNNLNPSEQFWVNMAIGAPNFANDTIPTTLREDIDLYIRPYIYGVICGEATDTVPNDTTPNDTTPVDTPSSVQEFFQVNNLKFYNAYPNPASDIVTVAFELKEASDYFRIDLVDQVGRRVFETELGQHLPAIRYDHRLDIEHLPPGLYHLRLTSQAGSMATRLVIRE